MSNYLAISGVTETLKKLLVSEMEMIDIPVTILPLDESPSDNSNAKRINLLLYKIEENAFLKNQEIPGDGHPAAYGNPPLSLVLYYMVTAFPEAGTNGDTADLGAHQMIADVMRVFNDHPILTDSMHIPQGTGTQPLLHSSLQNQFEKLKITLNPLDTEELSKIWLSSTKAYRLSVGYTVSVVRIESKKPRVSAQPVETRQLHMLQLRRPQIYDLLVTPLIEPPGPELRLPPATARIGDTVTIQGINFKGLSTRVFIGEDAIDVTPLSNDTIEFTVPDNPALQPGPMTIEVHVTLRTEVVKGGYDSLGETAERTNVVSSNQVALMIVPRISGIEPTGGNPTQILTITGDRLYNEGGKAYAILGDTVIEIRKLRVDNLDAARAALEAGIRNIESAPPTFANAKVARIDNRLYVIPGVAGDYFDFSESEGDSAITELGLNVGAPVPPILGKLSNQLSGFDGLDSDTAYINITIGSEGPHDVEIRGIQKPGANLDTARSALEAGIQAAHETSTFSTARVARVDDQLLIIPGNENDTITFSAYDLDPALTQLGLDGSEAVRYFRSADLPEFTGLTNDPAQLQIVNNGVDSRVIEITFPAPTPEKIQILLMALKDALKDEYPVRIRVNGGESRDDKKFELT